MNSLLAALILFSAFPSHTRPARIITAGSGNARVIALSFDAGADRGWAPRILRTLERRHVHASFGITGLWARANPDLVRRMVRDHDDLINHTYDHRSFTGFSTHTAPLSTRQRTWEIVHAEKIVRHITGRTLRPFFRPPFGDYDRATLRLIRHLGYGFMVMWTFDSLGWERLPARTILHRCLALSAPGSIILMHVGIQSRDALALGPLVRALKHRGYSFVTVSHFVRN